MTNKTSLNSMQKSFWYQSKVDGYDDSSNLVHKIIFAFKVSEDQFVSAVELIISKHPKMAINIKEINGEPYFYKTSKPTIIRSSSIKELGLPFNLNDETLIRYFIKNNEFYIASHHIIFDDISWNIFRKELVDVLRSNNSNIGLDSLDELVEGAYDTQNDLTYWSDKLADFERIVGVGKINNQFGESVSVVSAKKLDADLMREIISFARTSKISLNNLTMFLLGVVIHKINGNHQMVIATPVTMRRSLEDNNIGCLINVLPCVINLDCELSIVGNLKSFNDSVWIDLEHRSFSLVELGKRLSIDHNVGIYNVMAEYVKPNYTDGILSDDLLQNSKPKLDLIMSIIDSPDGPTVSIEYDGGKVDELYVDLILQKISKIMMAIVKDGSKRIAEIDLNDDFEKNLLIKIGTGKISNISDKNINKLFSSQVKLNGGRTAIRHNDKSLTYKQLSLLVEYYAHKILNRGISRGDAIGVYMERSIDYIAAMMSIWSIGGIYVPLDTTNPKDRTESHINKAQIKVVLTSAEEHFNGARSINIKKDNGFTENKKFKPIKICADDAAYIIFTSGSTGEPKGVIIKHRGFMNHLNIMIGQLSLDNNSIIAQTAPVSFDVSVWQLVCALMVGGVVEICDKATVIDVNEMYSTIKNRNINILETVPSLLSEYLDAENNNPRLKNGLKSVSVITTGEAVSRDIVQKWVNLYKNRILLNAYGPAEASDDTHFFPINYKALSHGQIPIGRPLDNIITYIIDTDGALCPMGIVGEICIGGIAVAAGYVNDKAITDRSFIKDPFGVDGVMYKTGDFGRWLKNGNLMFHGRRDHQVKIRGQRFELGEIENRMQEIKSIKDAAVIVKEFPANKRLIGFAVSRDGSIIDSENIKNILGEKLPCYMIPWQIIQVKDIYRNNNGKIDRKKLDAMYDKDSNINNNSTKDSTIVKTICMVWSSVLNTAVEPDTNFFDAGGDSLISIKMTSLLNEKGIHVSVRDIFNAQTPIELSKIASSSLEIKKGHRISKIKQLPIQKRYLYLSGIYSNFGEIQAAMFSHAKLNSANIRKLENDICLAYPSIKFQAIRVPINLDKLSQAYELVEGYRSNLSIENKMGLMVPINLKGKLKLLFVIHHYVFDVYSWDILFDDINNILLGQKLTERSDAAIYQWWGDNLDMHTKELKNTIKISDHNNAQLLKPTQYTVRHKLIGQSLFQDPDFIYYCVAKSVAKFIDQKELNFEIELSARALDKTGKLSNSIGWATYLVTRNLKITDSFKDYSQRYSHTSDIELSENTDNIIWSLNYIGRLAKANPEIKIIQTKIFREMPFAEVDIELGNNTIIYTINNNIGLSNKEVHYIADNATNLINQGRYGELANDETKKSILERIVHGSEN